MARRKLKRRPEPTGAEIVEEQTGQLIKSEQQVPVWVYILLLILVIALLLGVEAILDWLLPIPAR